MTRNPLETDTSLQRAIDYQEHSLQTGGVTKAGSTLMAVAGSAPAYSIAASTALLIGAAGVGAPAALLWCGIPMLGIAFAFSYLARVDSHAGASFSWVARGLTPYLGFFAGWAVVISATIFMVAGALPAGAMTVSLFAPDQANNTLLVTLVGAVWFLVMAAAVIFGVHTTERAQWIMSIIEVGILVVFAAIAIPRAITTYHHGQTFSWDWFGFGHLTGAGVFVAAALIAAFYYWGWDVTANLGEETKDAHKTTGAAGILGIVIVFILFEIYTTTTLVMLPGKTIEDNAANVLGVLGDAIMPGIGGKIMIVAVALSTIATLETTLVQVSRTLFAMGRDRTIPFAFGRINRKWKTPVFATLVVVGVSLLLFVLANVFGDSVGQILGWAISSIGLQIAFYYSLAGFAVVIGFRKVLFRSVKNFLLIGLWPAVGAIFMLYIFFAAIPNNEPVVNYLGLGLIVIGIVPMLLFYRRAKDAYFSRRPLEVPEDFDA
ncbi:MULTISPECIES: APC family permease [unclassified Microbacterium]|uniref:APC family permease n=1 Tax=unclassified Microbacterium TaxID=2609290 RepID=UPI001E3FFD69|nr:APC family permease [Microbacterium sp. Au-Mic1]MCE4026186.1 APC family permease [Microbacterium sp. Au-Mic1]